MKGAEACIALQGRPITERIPEALARRKYRMKVARHLKMARAEFEEVDWVSHSRAVGVEQSPALKRILWDHHPTQARLKMQRRSTGDKCAMCGEKDTMNHFYECKRVNESDK